MNGSDTWRAVVIGGVVGLIMAAVAVIVILQVQGDDGEDVSATGDESTTSTDAAGSTDTSDPATSSTDTSTSEPPDQSTTSAASSTTSTDPAPTPSGDEHWIMVSDHVAGSWTGSTWSVGADLAEVDGVSFVDTSTGEVVVLDDPVPAEFCYDDAGHDAVPVRGDGGGLDDEDPFDLLGVSDLSWDSRRGDSEEIEPASAHAEAVREWLEGVGLGAEPVTIRRVLRLDVEGDGTDEVLVLASEGETLLLGATPGAYTVLLLRRLDDVGEVVTQVLHESFAAPDAAPADGDPGLVDAYTWSFPHQDVVDLNGDGRLELVVDYTIYESWGWLVYDLGPAPTEVLSISCGV